MKYLEYNEKKQRGSSDFPIQFYHVTQYHPQYEMQLHWHREFEIIRVLSLISFLVTLRIITATSDIKKSLSITSSTTPP